MLGGKPIIRDLRIAVEHVLGMLTASDSPEMTLEEYPVLEPKGIQACLLFAYRTIAGERVHERVPIHEAGSFFRAHASASRSM